MIIVGADNRPSMLEKSLYDSWKSRMELYIENRENGRLILNSVQNGPLVWPTVVEEDGTTRTKRYEELLVGREFQADCDLNADEHVSSRSSPDEEHANETRLLDEKYQDPLAFVANYNQSPSQLNNCEGHMASQRTQPKKPRNATWFKEKEMLAEAQESAQILDAEQLAFLTEDLDAYDSDCDDVSNAKAVLMANLSNYGSHFILEAAIQDINLYAQRFNDLSVIEQMSKQMINHKAQRIKLTLYNGSVISSQHVAKPVIDDEVTLILEEVSRSKMLAKQNDPISKEKKVNTTPINYVELNRLSGDFGKCFVPQQELSGDQAFWLQTSHPNTDQSALSPVKIEAPKVSMVNASLKKLKYHLGQFDTVVKKRITPNAITEGEWGSNSRKVFVTTTLQNELRKLKGKNVLDNAATITNATYIALGMFKLDLDPLAPRYFDANRDVCFFDFINDLNVRSKSKTDKKSQHHNIWKPTGKVFTEIGYKWKPTGRLFTIVGNSCPLTRITPTKIVHLKETTSNSSETQKLEIKVYSRRPKQVKSVGCPDCSLVSGLRMLKTYDREPLSAHELRNIIVSRVYYVKGLRHNLLSVRQFRNADLKVAFRKNTCFIHNLEGVDLLSGSRDTNLYTISLYDMLKTSLICLLSKASKTKSWLWHRRLSHLNFGTLNKLAKDGLARGISKVKFKKDHLCSACALGKSKKSFLQPKAKDTNQEKLYLLHMDLCGPMRVKSINGKKTKDEAPDAIIKCNKNIQVRLNDIVHNVRADNGTEFVNQTLREFYENVDIRHQTSVARTPQ
ncbi:retrovirus-related pol polyprotein from transposon TNT 1-94 [Tanacetum coccineum]